MFVESTARYSETPATIFSSPSCSQKYRCTTARNAHVAGIRSHMGSSMARSYARLREERA